MVSGCIVSSWRNSTLAFSTFLTSRLFLFIKKEPPRCFHSKRKYLPWKRDSSLFFVSKWIFMKKTINQSQCLYRVDVFSSFLENHDPHHRRTSQLLPLFWIPRQNIFRNRLISEVSPEHMYSLPTHLAVSAWWPNRWVSFERDWLFANSIFFPCFRGHQLSALLSRLPSLLSSAARLSLHKAHYEM